MKTGLVKKNTVCVNLSELRALKGPRKGKYMMDVILKDKENKQIQVAIDLPVRIANMELRHYRGQRNSNTEVEVPKIVYPKSGATFHIKPRPQPMNVGEYPSIILDLEPYENKSANGINLSKLLIYFCVVDDYVHFDTSAFVKKVIEPGTYHCFKHRNDYINVRYDANKDRVCSYRYMLVVDGHVLKSEVIVASPEAVINFCGSVIDEKEFETLTGTCLWLS